MTPTLPEIIMGAYVALTAPSPPEASGDYAAARVGMIGMLCALAAQEAERGPSARLWENQALRSLFAQAAENYDGALAGKLSEAAAQAETDFTWSGLDQTNAGLRTILISLHEAAERRKDITLDQEILELYRQMATRRRLELPGGLQG